MNVKTLSLVVVASLASASPALGDAGGDGEKRFYVGGFAGWNFLDDDIELGNSFFEDQVPESAVLAGLRIRYDFLTLAPDTRLRPTLSAEIEGKMAFAEVAGNGGNRDDSFAPVLGWRAHAMASILTGDRAQPFLLVGVGGETVVTSSDYIDSPDTDSAFHWGAGVRYKLTDSFSMRLDFRQVITAGRDDFLSWNHEIHLGFGYHFSLFGGPEAPPPAPEPAKDSDGDGLMDHADKCPNEPEDLDSFEDEDGCPDPDNDGDKILDALDKCPDKPETANGIDDEDGCPETDDDGDGLVGSKDSCPTDAEDKDGFQDEDGCPDADNDADGLADAVDKCPLKPETANGYEDSDGCPDTVPDKIKRFTGTIKGIRFASGSSRIVRSSHRVLKAAVKIMKEFPAINIEIAGHTDNTGTRMRNVVLSRARAESVKKFMVKRGIPTERIQTIGHGPDKPIDVNTTRKGRAANRRIEFRLVNAPAPTPTPTPTPTPAPAAPPN